MIVIFSLVLFFSNSIVINNISVNAELTSVIETEKGPVQGEILVSVNKKIKFSSFRGIPYGKPPIGINRFKVKFCGEKKFINFSYRQVFSQHKKLKHGKMFSKQLPKQLHVLK